MAIILGLSGAQLPSSEISTYSVLVGVRETLGRGSERPQGKRNPSSLISVMLSRGDK